MGDICSTTRIGSTFDSAFKHNYTYATKTTPENKLEDENNSSKNTQMNFRLGKLPKFNPIEQSNQIIIDTVTTPTKTNSQMIKTLAVIGSSAAVVGGTTLAITKGKIPKATTKYMGEFINNISQKIENIKMKQDKTVFTGLYISTLQKVNKGLMTARGLIFNITPMKDVLFEKIIAGKLGLKKPCDAITNGFRKLSHSTVKSSYRSAGNSITEMTSLFRETNKALANGTIKRTKPVSKETLTKLEEKTSQIETSFNKNFSEQAIDKRDKQVTNICKDLNTRVYNKVYGNLKNFIKDIKSWTTFIPEALISQDKSKFTKSLFQNKSNITNNPLDNYKRLSETISKLEQNINPSDKNSIKLLTDLKSLIDRYPKASGSQEAEIRASINKKINETLKSSKEILNNKEHYPTSTGRIQNLLKEIGTIINADKKGLIEDILTTYKEILPPDEYKKLKIMAQKCTNKLNRATQQEGSEYVDKVRDLVDGSALTDVALSMALPVASTGIAISAANTKEKKKSVALNYGLPIISGAITTTIATIKLVSGGKSLALGLLSTFITNQICGKIDDKIKEKSKKSGIS